ncbi:MAG: PIN domain-containing protein [Cyanobacteriota bacterium]|nr:PIN domain-containing protein [Cyanobacteriota bacterium]
MKTVFVDTFYWIAITNPQDRWHQRAKAVRETLKARKFVTTELVLIEFLNYFCAYNAQMQQTATQVTRRILSHPEVEVVWHARDSFESGLTLYERCIDRRYSLVDCASIAVMRQRALVDVLSRNRHFAREGFNLLL